MLGMVLHVLHCRTWLHHWHCIPALAQCVMLHGSSLCPGTAKLGLALP